MALPSDRQQEPHALLYVPFLAQAPALPPSTPQLEAHKRDAVWIKKSLNQTGSAARPPKSGSPFSPGRSSSLLLEGTGCESEPEMISLVLSALQQSWQVCERVRKAGAVPSRPPRPSSLGTGRVQGLLLATLPRQEHFVQLSGFISLGGTCPQHCHLVGKSLRCKGWEVEAGRAHHINLVS